MRVMRERCSLRSWSARGAVFLILTCALVQPAPGARPAQALDLAAAARAANAAGAPLVVLFTQPDCPYCERAKRDYLDPMAAAGAQPRLHLVEVDITSAASLADFSGRASTHHAFALAHRARLTPTLGFFDARGETLADPLVGLTVPDLYQGLLDGRLEQARVRLRRATP